MKKIFLTFFIYSMLFAQEYYIYKLKGRINLDGKIDEEIWDKVPIATGFKITGSKIYAKRQTYFRAFYDDENIYIGIKCKEPEINKIKASLLDEGALWDEDSIEIFFQPEKETYYYQFVINGIGSRWCRKLLGKDSSFALGYDWNTRVYKNKDYYSLEVVIPFKLINKKPIKDEKWRVNISRNILTDPKERYTSWPNFKVINFHAIDEFGYFIFKDDLDYSKIEKIEEEINRDYITSIKKSIEEFLGYEKEVKELLQKQKLKDELKDELKMIAEKMNEIQRISKEKIRIKKLEKIENPVFMIEKLEGIKSKVLTEELFE